MIRLIVNWAPFVEGSEGYARQQRGWRYLSRLTITEPDVVSSTVVCPVDPLSPHDCSVLPRCVGRRNLPYIKDMLASVRREAATDDWIGFLNSDAVPGPQMISRVRKTAKDVVLVNVTDIGGIKAARLRPVGGWSIDGMLIRASLWDEIAQVFPEVVLGAALWDTVAVMWFAEQKIKAEWLAKRECLHHRHRSTAWMKERGQRGDGYRTRDESYKINLLALNTVGGMSRIKSFFGKSKRTY